MKKQAAKRLLNVVKYLVMIIFMGAVFMMGGLAVAMDGHPLTPISGIVAFTAGWFGSILFNITQGD